MKEVHPPRLAERLFDWYCGFAKVEDLRGDLEEWFYLNAKNKSPFRAKLIYWQHVISLVASYAIRKRKKAVRLGVYSSSSSFSYAMLKNYLIVAVRNLYQYRYFSVLNAFGLAIGMSISLLLISMYSYISTYDNFHTERENIYSITARRTEGVEQFDFASSPAALAEKLAGELGGLREVIRLNSSFEGQVKTDKENIPLRGYYADANFFSVFSFDMLNGNPTRALAKPYTVVLTESAAIKLFGGHDVVGKQIEVEGLGYFEITGLMKDHPKNTHLEFEAIASYSTLPPATGTTETSWSDFANQYTYVVLGAETSLEELRHYLVRTAAAVYHNTPVKVSFMPMALDDLVTTDLRNAIGPQWERSGFVVFGIIALIILLPGCFNYTNISIARALKRSKEIGLRKAMGGLKNQIFLQFITETVVITLIALVGALFIFMLIRSEFQSMLVEASALDLRLTVRTLGAFLLFAVLVGLMAGVFPALYFAGLNPIQALKSQTNQKGLSAMRLRKGLTIFQFGLSFCFIVCMIVFSRQYNTLLNFDFGFQRDNIINVELKQANSALLKTEFAKLSPVQAVALSSGSLGISSSRTWLQHTNSPDSIEVNQLFVDPDYFTVFNLQLIEGRIFPSDNWQREQFLIVNEAFLKANQIDTPGDVIGRTYLADGQELSVLGVLKDFHYAPPGVPISSFVFRMDPSQFTQANLSADVADVYEVFSALEKTWKTVSAREPFEAAFFNDELNEAYVSYRALLKIAGFLGLLAITISVLGLLGMVVYTSETRVKEVSIRKVLGASATTITILLSKDYLRLILWAILFALPVAFFVFEVVFSRIPGYQVNLTLPDMVLSAFALLALGLITITSQTYKTALANPADTLKSE